MRDGEEVMGSMGCKSWWDRRSLEGVKAGNLGGDGQNVTPHIVVMEDLLLAMTRLLNSDLISVFKGLGSFPLVNLFQLAITHSLVCLLPLLDYKHQKDRDCMFFFTIISLESRVVPGQL